MRRRLLALVAVLLVVVSVGWAAARAQTTPAPGDPDYLDNRIARLLATPTDAYSSDQMFRLLGFIWADSLSRAGALLLDPNLLADQTLRTQLIAETGTWEAVYRAARALPPVNDPQLVPFQRDALGAMQRSIRIAPAVRDFALTGNEASLNAVIPDIEVISAVLGAYAP